MSSPSPIDVRLIGDDAAVRRLVAILESVIHTGPVSYRSSRYSDGTRAYLTIVVTDADESE
ncbi:hypothetical protein [Streptomyces sp. NPDC059631]|uniref:hypothetical protein n=1 Tax=unclassified Streptomyces TaxID=2593676 RepID=UPI003680393B